MGLLNDRVALLAGVGVDLGTALARVFAAEGADLVLAARSENTIRALASEIEGMGRKCVWQCTDITDADACNSLVAREPNPSWAGSTSSSTTLSGPTAMGRWRTRTSKTGERPWT